MKKLILVFLATAMVLSACVSKKKYQASQNRIVALASDSSGTHYKLNECDSKVVGLEADKKALQQDLNDFTTNAQNTIANSKMTIADQAKRLKYLQDLIQTQKDMLNKLKKTVADALVNFSPDELSVTLKDGKLYVSLQEKLLFKSGSAEVDPKGKDALKSLAAVLNNTPDISVLIEGHTDTVPIKGKFEDNWALSTARATSIVRILTKSYGVDAHRVVASGRGEFVPVDDNKTEGGRARNRRTEIILSPNLNELFKILNQ